MDAHFDTGSRHLRFVLAKLNINEGIPIPTTTMEEICRVNGLKNTHGM